MIYFDNASTTKIDKSVLEVMIEAYENYFANPSSLHSLGFKVEKAIKEAREIIAKQLNISDKNLYFTPSGTISNNAVLDIYDQKGKNIIVSKIEHKSIENKVKNFKYAEVRYVITDKYGMIDKNDLLSKIDDNTVLISIMHVNNELGTINDINYLSKIAKEKNKNINFHSDGVQAFKKININLRDIDYYTISSHKINGPKGISALYIRKPESFKALYYGGSQEKGLFSGTENVQAILGFAKASTLDNNFSNIIKINNYLREEILKIENSIIVSPKKEVSPYILNICFEKIGAEILLHYLEMDEVFISTGSACNKDEKSYVIEELKIDDKYRNGCIRISLSKNSTMEEAKEFINILKEKIKIIRRILG